MFREREVAAAPRVLMLLVWTVGFFASCWWLVSAIRAHEGWSLLGSLLAMAIDVLMFFGLFIVNPNEAQVVTLFGNYGGSMRRTGLWWVNPFTARRRVSM